jgi:subtilisin family serine protease
VLDDEGNGQDSWVLAGMEWAAAQGADVVNLSLSTRYPADGLSPLDQAVNRLTTESGALFVVAAGNGGPGSQTIGSPAAADAALAVGAVDKSGQLAPFSSRGQRRGDGAIKPDITAPGVGIVVARATPHVAGAAAILAGQHPDWTPGQLKAALMGAAQPNPHLSVHEQGAGRVDVARATTQRLRTDTGSLSLGTAH